MVFKIEISDEGLRNGLNVTVNILWNANDYTQGICTHENKVLSCMRVKSQGQQDKELIYLLRKNMEVLLGKIKALAKQRILLMLNYLI